MTLLDVLRNIWDNCLFIGLNFPLTSFLALIIRRALKEKAYILLERNTATLSLTLIRNSKIDKQITTPSQYKVIW
jgi:hypothetical protein